MAFYANEFPDVSPFEDTRGKVSYYRNFSIWIFGDSQSIVSVYGDVFPLEHTQVKLKPLTISSYGESMIY